MDPLEDSPSNAPHLGTVLPAAAAAAGTLLMAAGVTWMTVETALVMRQRRRFDAEAHRAKLTSSAKAEDLLQEAERLLGEIRVAKEADPERLSRLGEALFDGAEKLRQK